LYSFLMVSFSYVTIFPNLFILGSFHIFTALLLGLFIIALRYGISATTIFCLPACHATQHCDCDCQQQCQQKYETENRLFSSARWWVTRNDTIFR
jgi:hypothetical protein